MTPDTADLPDVPDVVCTLTTKALATRALEWSDLADLAIRREELPDGVRSTYPAQHEPGIDELVARERDCCGTWLDIVVHRSPSEITLEITTRNPAGLAVVRRMSGIDPAPAT